MRHSDEKKKLLISGSNESEMTFFPDWDEFGQQQQAIDLSNEDFE